MAPDGLFSRSGGPQSLIAIKIRTSIEMATSE